MQVIKKKAAPTKKTATVPLDPLASKSYQFSGGNSDKKSGVATDSMPAKSQSKKSSTQRVPV